MQKLTAALMASGLVCAGGAAASDGRQLYDDFRCIGCHGQDGKGAGANVKGVKPIAGTNSDVTYGVITKMIREGGANHKADSCNVLPTEQEMRVISEYVASLPR